MTTKPETTPQSDITGAAMSGTQADIVDLLRLHSYQQAMIPSNMMRLAADEIERLHSHYPAMEARCVETAVLWESPTPRRKP